MFKTGPNYTGFSSLLTECLLNNTVAEETTKKIDQTILKVALTIFQQRHKDTVQRLKINGFTHPQQASVLDDQIKKYTENLESIFKGFNLSSTEGSALLNEMQDQGGKDV
jgi:hypothetical protein